MGTAARIGELAKEKGIALKELSRRADIPYTTLYNAVKRDSKMDLKTIQKIADALDVEPGKIVGNTEWAYMVGFDCLKKFEDADELICRRPDMKTGEIVETLEKTPLKKEMDDIFSRLNRNGKQLVVELSKVVLNIPAYQRYPDDPRNTPAGADGKEPDEK